MHALSLRSPTFTIIALGWVAGALSAAAQPLEPPRLDIDAPAELAAVAARLRAYDPDRLAGVMRVVGLRAPGPDIRVTAVTEADPIARTTPRWVVGFANPADATIVLFPARTPAYPDDSLEALLHHEVAHVLIHRASGGRPVPRWFNEGLAMTAERVWRLEDRGRMALELVRGSAVSLADLDPLFASTSGDVARAYAMSGAFVRYLFDQYGATVCARVLDEMSRGSSFGGAFLLVTGHALASVESRFWRRTVLWYRWVPFLTSSAFLWIGITTLALIAIRKRRARSAAMRRDWDREEVEPDPMDDEPPRWIH